MELKEAQKYIDEHHGLPRDISEAIPLLLSGAGQIPEHAKTEADLRQDQKKYLRTLARMNGFLSQTLNLQIEKELEKEAAERGKVKFEIAPHKIFKEQTQEQKFNLTNLKLGLTKRIEQQLEKEAIECQNRLQKLDVNPNIIANLERSLLNLD